MNKETEKKLAALRRAIDKELKSLGAVTLPGVDGVADWMTKTWNNFKKSDVIEDTVMTRRRNALRLARKSSLPALERNLASNHFRAVIVDLALEIVDDQIVFSETDTLYALELALELSQLNSGVPVHSLLLNAIHQNADAYGSLELLRQVDDPVQADRYEQLKTINFFYSGDTLPESEVESTVEDDAAMNLNADRLDAMRAKSLKSPIIVPALSKADPRLSTDSELFTTDVTAFDGLAGDITFIEQRDKNVRKSREAVVAQWTRIEERMRSRVEALRAENPDEAFKLELRERQKGVETLVYCTEKACADEEELAYFKELMLETLPAFKSVMGRNISKRPEFAKQVYDVLDKLAECGVAVHDYLYAAVSLAQTSDASVLTEAMDDLSFGQLGENAASHVMSLIEKSKTKSRKASPKSNDSTLSVAFAAR